MRVIQSRVIAGDQRPLWDGTVGFRSPQTRYISPLNVMGVGIPFFNCLPPVVMVTGKAHLLAPNLGWKIGREAGLCFILSAVWDSNVTPMGSDGASVPYILEEVGNSGHIHSGRQWVHDVKRQRGIYGTAQRNTGRTPPPRSKPKHTYILHTHVIWSC